MNIFSKLGIRMEESSFHPKIPDDIIKRFTTRKNNYTDSIEMRIVGNTVFLKVPPGANKWWSPELTLRIELKPEGSIVKEIAGPNPGTFTLAMFVIIAAIVIIFFALMFVFSQIQLGLPPLISLLVIGGSSLIVLLVLVILSWGRRKAKPQMKEMKNFVSDVILWD